MIRAAILLVLATCASVFAGEMRLWYDKPAAKWEEALPVGSGRLGAMVFGGTGEERIQFNEDTLWTGKPHDYVRQGAYEHLAEIRRLVLEGKEKEAGEIVRKSFLSDPVRQKAYQPFGDLRFTFAGQGETSEYRRELELSSAVARVSYKAGGVTFTREVFASYPDNVIVVNILADKPGALSFEVGMTSPHKTATTRPAGNDTIAVAGQVRDLVPPNEMGMRFEARLKAVLPVGGKVKVEGGKIRVEEATAAMLLVVAATDFVSFQDISGDPAARCEKYLKAVEGKSYAELKSRHEADFQKLFGRVSIDLGSGEREKLPTDQRLKAVRAAMGNPAPKAASDGLKLSPEGLDADPGLAALFFQYGRYLLISSSRPGCQPANLQGVWNELINPPWESKYTTNINFQMNYWPAELTNLAECHEPVFAMVEDLRLSGGRTAQKQYHARGWVLHHNTDHWRGTAPINNVDGVWPTGGAWLCHHLWERYLYSGDEDFLKRSYPAMKEASLFFVDYLTKHPKHGWLVTNPSISPEQGPLCAGPAMDNQIVRALLDETMEAAGILGVDGEFVKELEKVRGQLPPNQIGKHGQLQEWLEDVDEPNNAHRHMSPLWALYPGNDITPASGKVFEAAKVLLKWRGDGSTGWSYAWRIPLWARVRDGEFAYRQLYLQLAKRTLPNLFDLCGPFQIDGNFGACAGIGEMLLQSHVRDAKAKVHEIELLPALPKAWGTGRVKGLRARGGFEVEMSWENGKLTGGFVRSSLGGPCRMRYGDRTASFQTQAGSSYQLPTFNP